MYRMSFEPPTDYYDEKLAKLDEQLCKLLKERKEVSNNNPGFPPQPLISSWAEKYDLYEDFLNITFASLLNEEIFLPVVEPKGFIRNIPILKSFEKDDVFYSVTFIRQFENASVVNFTKDQSYSADLNEMHESGLSFFELSIEGGKTEYKCRSEGGGGSDGHTSFSYIVTPPLPEDPSTYKMIFTECKGPHQKPIGTEIVI